MAEVRDIAWSDDQRSQTVIASVTEHETGYDILQDSGWGCGLSKEHGVVPVEGQTLTLWGKGIGYAFRGLADAMADQWSDIIPDLFAQGARHHG